MVAERRAHGQADLAEFGASLSAARAELDPPSAVDAYLAHTDGACFGNPDGPGGWAAVVDLGATRWELWGPLSSTSNNRAEALGVLAALEWVPAGSRLVVRADSELSIKILKGVYKARANTDIWTEIRRVIDDKHIQLTPEWVPGHAGLPENELADELSKNGARMAEAARGMAARPSNPQPQRVRPELAGLAPRGEWETEFVKSIVRQLNAGRTLTPKQQAIVDRIRARPPTS